MLNMLVTLLLVCFIKYSIAVTELLHNSDFEGTTFGGNWICSACTLTRSNDHYHGQHSGRITHRFNEAGNVAAVTYIQSQTTGHNKYIIVSVMKTLQKNFGWTEIGGDFHVPSGVHSIDVYIDIQEHDVNYLVDSMSLQQIPNNNNWKTEANQRIKSLRMAPLTVRVNNSASLDTSNMEIEVKQLKHKFPFGSAVSADIMVDPKYKKYQDYFYDNFEWAVLANALKWRMMEWRPGHIDYDTPMHAVNALRDRGIIVRGHNMFWDFDKHSPAWLHNLSQNELLTAMHTRVNGTLSHTKGKLVHWDVNNENLHGDYFERRLHNPNITLAMFRWLHQIEPGVKLFLNDYNVISSNTYTTAYKVQATIFKSANVPVYGIGIQCHFPTSNIDFTAVKYRIDKIAEAGLPIWVTELTVLKPNENKKADALENALTLFFSHPAIEGIFLWGFWDGKTFDNRTSLTNGVNVKPNAAGIRYHTLFKQTWRTNIAQQLRHGIHIAGYHGQYTLNVKRNGHVIESQNYTLGAKGKVVTVNLHGSDAHALSTSVFG